MSSTEGPVTLQLSAGEMRALGIAPRRPSPAPLVAAVVTVAVLFGTVNVGYGRLVRRGDPGRCPGWAPEDVAALADSALSSGCCVRELPRVRTVCAVSASVSRCDPVMSGRGDDAGSMACSDQRIRTRR